VVGMVAQFLSKSFKSAGQGDLVAGPSQMIEGGAQEAMGR